MGKLERYAGKPLASCDTDTLYHALLRLVEDTAQTRGYNTGKKKVYYISAEFLTGRLLINDLIALGLYDGVCAELSAAGRELSEIEDAEAEPSLGNGGLGRLAACFLDSLAALGIPADGVGLFYHCGLFRQSFRHGKQTELPDRWLGADNRFFRTDRRYAIDCGGLTLPAVMYELAVPGYEGKCGRLRLFDLETADEEIVQDGISFDKTNVKKNLTLFLYPDDSDEKGRLLRVYQEYFLSACAARLILEECVEKGGDLHELPDYAAVQINDTHPSLVIPELVWLLEGKGIAPDEAYRIVTAVCGYTNHTILAEALETWSLTAIKTVAPHLVPVIRAMDAYAGGNAATRILDAKNRVHMAHMDIHYSHSVNGVARLHTEILKHSELKAFYARYPDRFHNKTNGVTFRRWLMACNPELSALLTRAIGDGWKRDAMRLQELLPYAEDETFLRELLAVKQTKKAQLAAWLQQRQGIALDPDFVFDIQAKRLHEYKRQQLNLLWAVDLALRIREGYRPKRPVAVLFAAKAAPAYVMAKDIIHAVVTFGAVLRADPAVSPWLRVAMPENYNVAMAEKLIPAADISEQISLASKEASGTGNMKFMLNGALTLGTMDGANVEISELVGEGNLYTFGLSADDVIRAYAKKTYDAKAVYLKDRRLRRAVDFLLGPEMTAHGDRVSLRRLHRELTEKDWFMTFADFRAYLDAKESVLSDYEDRMAWARKMTVNIAAAGYFSSDRTIRQYNQDVWHISPEEGTL